MAAVAAPNGHCTARVDGGSPGAHWPAERLPCSGVEIERLRWRPANLAKLAEHQIGQGEVEELINTGNIYTVDVHPDYPDQLRITGPTRTGRFITVVLESTETSGAR